MPPAPTAQQLDHVLARLDVLTPTQAIRDPELNRALAPFRGHPPTALICANATCSEPFAWVALDPSSARVRFGLSAPAAAPSEATRRLPAPFDRWAPDEEAGVSIAPPGEPLLRWRFRCPRCGRPCVLGNGRLIALIARAVASGRAALRPAAE